MRVLTTAFFCLVSVPVQACDLALALAVDVSGSVDPREFGVQMQGLAEGIRDPIVSEALVQGKARLMLVQWTGASRQRVTIPWTEVGDFEALEAFADKIEQDQRIWRNYSTAIGDALAFTLSKFDEVPDCLRHLIDVSGDGQSNEGEEPGDQKKALRAAQVTVNAIAIEESESDLTAYFFENVITGEGAFVVTAENFDDYPEKIRKKLLREVTQQTSGRFLPRPKVTVVTNRSNR